MWLTCPRAQAAAKPPVFSSCRCLNHGRPSIEDIQRCSIGQLYVLGRQIDELIRLCGELGDGHSPFPPDEGRYSLHLLHRDVDELQGKQQGS